MADPLELAAGIVAAYVGKNSVDNGQVSDMIRLVYQSLITAVKQGEEPKPAEPAVPVKKSVFQDHLVCLECGGSYKVIKRHLQTDHNLTLNEYRQKFHLPHDYPMVSPDYAQTRSKLAKKIGLGRKAGRKPARKRA